MKFSIRVKFFLVLLAFSLGPMLVIRGMMGQQAGRAARQISDETRNEMLEIISTDLENNAIRFLSFLMARDQSISLAVQLLAQQAHYHLLAAEAPAVNKIYFASNFSPGGKAPADLAEVSGYSRRAYDGKTIPLAVSMGQAAFRFPRHTRDDSHYDEANRLNLLLPTMRGTLKQLHLTASWLNVGLESGVFATYPGHGFFPFSFDHRDQQWYNKARQATDEAAWTTPVVDPATRLAVATASYPIRDGDGRFLGAVSLDVPIANILEEVSLKSRWSEQIESFMVKYEPADENHDARLLVLAQQAYDEGEQRHWRSGIKTEAMASSDTEGFRAFLRQLSTHSSGVVNLPYKGQDCFWAFASNDEISFLLIAPNSVIAELPDAMGDTVELLFDEIRHISTVVSGVVFILVGFIAWLGSKAITRPLLAMAGAAKRLAAGDTNARIDVRTGDERDELINAFNDMAPKLREHLSMRRDFELAHEVQTLLLPRTEPTLSGFDISGGIAFCDQTGGDYYDFIELTAGSGNALGVALGDVSGHGIASALLMATARGQLHSLSHVPLSPKERIRAINAVLSQDMDGTGRFLTLFYIRLQADDPVVRWVRAGHDPAIRYNPATGEFGELYGKGLALGVLAEYEFEEYQTTLEPGELLVLATDGVWEARDEQGRMFGKERILAIVRENAHMNAEGIRKAIMDAVEAYQTNGQEDDIAVVVIRKA